MAISEKIIKHQKWWLLVLTLAIIILSVVTTLWIRGVLLPVRGQAKTLQNVTLTDAVMSCENEIRSIYKSRLRYLTLDNLSSRYDNSAKIYRVFFLADIQIDKSQTTPEAQFLVSCHVNAGRGDIIGIEALEKRETTTEPIRKREGGIFGWPI